jgi:hypothetical protein
MRFSYVVDNDGAYSTDIGGRYVNGLWGTGPRSDAFDVELDSPSSDMAATVPRDDRRVLRLDARDAPLVTCAAYVAGYDSDGPVVHTLTTVRLPWGSYSRRGYDIDECDGIEENPVGIAILGAMALFALVVVLAVAYGAFRLVRRHRRRRRAALAASGPERIEQDPRSAPP